MKKIYDYICSKILIMNSWLNILIDRATSQGYKSNVLRPITSIVAIILASSIYYCYQGSFALAFLSLCLVIVFAVLFIGTFLYCIIKKPDLLRSERYNLQMKAMEQNISSSGDSSDKKMRKTFYDKRKGTSGDTGFVFYSSAKKNEGGSKS